MLLLQKILIGLLIVLQLFAAIIEINGRKISGANGFIIFSSTLVCTVLSVLGFFLAWYNSNLTTAFIYLLAYLAWSFGSIYLCVRWIEFLHQRDKRKGK